MSQAPNISVGIVSGLNRIWGKAIQTDAKISPSNYGGPLVDIQGRVLGVLVPLSPDSTDNVAGVEWYDSGIGFAITLSHVNSVLPRLTQGQDLKPGILGVNLNSRDIYTQPPVIAGCRPNSPAYKAGFKAADRIIEIDGRPIERAGSVAQANGSPLCRRHAARRRRCAAKSAIERDLTLVDALDPYQRPFLGILPRARARRKRESLSATFTLTARRPGLACNLATGSRRLDGQAVANRERAHRSN